MFPIMGSRVEEWKGGTIDNIIADSLRDIMGMSVKLFKILGGVQLLGVE